MVYRVWHFASNRSIRRAARARGVQAGRPIYKLNYYNADFETDYTNSASNIISRVDRRLRCSIETKYLRGVSSDDGVMRDTRRTLMKYRNRETVAPYLFERKRPAKILRK